MTCQDKHASESAIGIMRCLLLLAEEASALNLQCTARAIEAASETILRESKPVRDGQFPALN